MVRLGLVVARFNAPVTDKMESAAREAARDSGATIGETVSVPGAYDAPLAADCLARRSDIDAVVVIGAIITGETGHDSVIGQATARSLTEISLERDTPVTLGITGPDMTAEQARERIDYAAQAVESALSLVDALP